MRNSTTILATIALGAVLAIGSATASMASIARGGNDGGAVFIRSHGGFGGGRSFGSHPFTMSHGGFGMRRGFGTRHGFNGDRHFEGRRHLGRFRDRDGFDGFFAFAPFLGLGQYDYCGNYRSYDPAWGTYLGRSRHRYYCP